MYEQEEFTGDLETWLVKKRKESEKLRFLCYAGVFYNTRLTDKQKYKQTEIRSIRSGHKLLKVSI